MRAPLSYPNLDPRQIRADVVRAAIGRIRSAQRRVAEAFEVELKVEIHRGDVGAAVTARVRAERGFDQVCDEVQDALLEAISEVPVVHQVDKL